MSNQEKLASVKSRLQALLEEQASLQQLRKSAFMPAPPMPQGPPPMDPAMMQGGAPPVDPATGIPMDPAMMQGGAPPMDPAMMQGGAPPVDPATGMPMDPAMMQGGGAPQQPAVTPEVIEQIVGLLEEMGQRLEALTAENQQLKASLEQSVGDLSDQVIELDKAMSALAAKGDAQAAAAPAPAGW